MEKVLLRIEPEAEFSVMRRAISSVNSYSEGHEIQWRGIYGYGQGIELYIKLPDPPGLNEPGKIVATEPEPF